MNRLAYHLWNEAVGRYCFRIENANRPIRFAIDPIVLQRAASESPRGFHFPTPDSAAEDFRCAVVTRIEDKGWGFGGRDPNRIPGGLAKLALQVLAVFEITADGAGYGSYWDALNRTLGREETGQKPNDLKYATHQTNWDQLVKWANDLNRERLGRLPEPDWRPGRQFVRAPLSHGLLRLEDLKSLPRFFRRVGWVPGGEVDLDEVERVLRRYRDDNGSFPRRHARNVLRNERLPLAAIQIADALAQWDGSDPLNLRAEKRTFRLWFAPSGREKAKLRGGLLEIKPSGEQRLVSSPGLADILKKGDVAGFDSPDVRYRPLRSDFVLAVRSTLDGRYLESRYIQPGARVILAKPGREEDGRFLRQLSRIAAAERVEVFPPEPSLGWHGWIAFRLQIREDIEDWDIPPIFAKILITSTPRLRISGGLRVGGAWLEATGPTLTVVNCDADRVIVDGEEFAVVENRLQAERCPALNAVGDHEAWLPWPYRAQVRFRVRKPTIARFTSPVVQAGWERCDPPDWPILQRGSAESNCSGFRGPAIEGDWPPIEPKPPNYGHPTSIALRLARAIRRPTASMRIEAIEAAESNTRHHNLLIRQLARSASMRITPAKDASDV